MDSLINAAARALGQGQPLSALKLVALRDDAHALALRGMAMAQLGDLPLAQSLLKRAAKAFGPRELLSRARCATAEAEVALAARDLRVDLRALEAALRTFMELGRADNLRHAALLRARWSLVLGDVAGAEQRRDAIELPDASAMLRCIAALLDFDLAMRRGRGAGAEQAVRAAREHAEQSGIAGLAAEVTRARAMLEAPAARRLGPEGDRAITLREVERVRASDALVIDGCARAVTLGAARLDLARRPVLFALLEALAARAPASASRLELVRAGFGARRLNDSLRARLRVELGRLRKLLAGLAAIDAADDGFRLLPGARQVVVLAPPFDDEASSVLALLGDGAAWSTSALALALGTSQRSVQRALSSQLEAGRVRSLGEGRARRWVYVGASVFATALLLPAPDLPR